MLPKQTSENANNSNLFRQVVWRLQSAIDIQTLFIYGVIEGLRLFFLYFKSDDIVTVSAV